jgi:hypothetical protein
MDRTEKPKSEFETATLEPERVELTIIREEAMSPLSTSGGSWLLLNSLETETVPA